MGDMAEIYRQMDKDKKNRKAQNMKENMRILNESDIDYELSNQGCVTSCSEIPANPMLIFIQVLTNGYCEAPNFYSKHKTFYGDAQRMLAWYAKQGESEFKHQVRKAIKED